MFSALLDAARNSPFKTPFTKAQCDGAAAPVAENPKSLIASGRTLAAAASDEVEFGSTQFYLLCGVGGIISCGSTHTFVVPLDLVKCRLQVDQAKYKNLFHGFKVSVAEEGAKGLVKGWAPTFFGYSAQVGKMGGMDDKIVGVI